MLVEARIGRVVDVRRLPGSRRCPWFDGDALALSLSRAGIAYEHVPVLGGLRSATKSVPEETNAWWQNESFHRYADHATTPAFREGLSRLLALGGRERCALLCAEAVYWRCHRRIIADHLLARGAEVWHLLGPGKREPARLSAGARLRGVEVTYPVAGGETAATDAKSPRRPGAPRSRPADKRGGVEPSVADPAQPANSTAPSSTRPKRMSARSRR